MSDALNDKHDEAKGHMRAAAMLVRDIANQNIAVVRLDEALAILNSSAPSAIGTRDAQEFIATMAREYGPEAAEATREFLSAPPSHVAPTNGAYRWIEEAAFMLRGYRQHFDPTTEDAKVIDRLLSGVPCPQEDLGFDSPADRAARSSTAPRWLDEAVETLDNVAGLLQLAGFKADCSIRHQLAIARSQVNETRRSTPSATGTRPVEKGWQQCAPFDGMKNGDIRGQWYPYSYNQPEIFVMSIGQCWRFVAPPIPESKATDGRANLSTKEKS